MFLIKTNPSTVKGLVEQPNIKITISFTIYYYLISNQLRPLGTFAQLYVQSLNTKKVQYSLNSL